MADLHVEHLWLANSVLHEIKGLDPIIVYLPPPMEYMDEACLLAFSDASQGRSS